MNDSVLDLAATDDRTVFAALADGLVAVIQVRNIGQPVGLFDNKDPSYSHRHSPSPPFSLQNVSESAPDTDPLLFRVGSTAVSCLALPPGPNQTLWCGCGKSITIMCAR